MAKTKTKLEIKKGKNYIITGKMPKKQPIENRANVLKEFLKDHLMQYFKGPTHIGFTKAFPEDPKGVIDEILFESEGLKFNVRYTKVTFGDKNEFSCSAIVTDRATIDRSKMFLGGFGSNTYHDEALIMRHAVIFMAKKHGLMICNDYCSWPFAKAIVQPVEDTHLRYFLSENKTP